ncbi:HIT family protein [Ornithinimicrobium sp. Y1847]|uniref:HIT family protein n=1 Tax=unclassified Ornithinimicrobium TaxID=2615080 RepID=UPI003B66DE0B
MPETPQQWYDRTRAAIDTDGYREADLQQWRSWPWTGELTPKELEPPVEAEPDRFGAGGVDCRTCSAVQVLDPGYVVWHDEGWILGLPHEPRALPFALFLMPKRHADLRDLTSAEAARQGELLTAVEAAACAVLDVPRIQAARWGDGGEHLHWWLYARPTGMLQLRGTFLAHWDDLLPAVPAGQFRADQLLVVAELARRVGGTAVEA